MASEDLLIVHRDRFQLLDAGVAISKLKLGGAQRTVGKN